MEDVHPSKVEVDLRHIFTCPECHRTVICEKGCLPGTNEQPVHAIHSSGQEMNVQEYNRYLRQALDTKKIDIENRPYFIAHPSSIDIPRF